MLRQAVGSNGNSAKNLHFKILMSPKYASFPWKVSWNWLGLFLANFSYHACSFGKFEQKKLDMIQKTNCNAIIRINNILPFYFC
jgi:hypothetical protein